jgi:hypothetical protein
MEMVLQDLKNWQTKIDEELVLMHQQLVNLQQGIEDGEKRKAELAEVLSKLEPTVEE